VSEAAARPPARPDDERVVAVIVTRHRPESLAQALKALAVQTRPVDSVVVVDNGPDQPAEEVVRASGLPHTYLLSRANLGGAGGFALGMLTALAEGADWVWCADDDGRPADEHVLATLLSVARERGLAEVSPAVADIDAPGSFAFPVRTGLRWKGERDRLGGEDFLPGYASLFNGALFAAATRPRSTAGWCAPACPSGRRSTPPTCTPTAGTSSSRSSAGGCPRSTPRRSGSATTPTATAGT
jgi:rhamnopyranosyl-N-acetylglucosaminyl-diphospho-decaprenol beta-1,3/1,4-galactofuranosyltransferase